MAHPVNVDIDADALGAALGQALAAHGNPNGQSKRVPLLKGTDPAEWKDWILRFEMVATIANWKDLRKKRELYTRSEGDSHQRGSRISPSRIHQEGPPQA